MGSGGGLVKGDRVDKADMRTGRVVEESMREGVDKITIDTTTIIVVTRHRDIITITIITIKETIHLQTGEDLIAIIMTIVTTTDSKEETIMMTTITIMKILKTDKTDSFQTTIRDKNHNNKMNESNQTPQEVYNWKRERNLFQNRDQTLASRRMG